MVGTTRLLTLALVLAVMPLSGRAQSQGQAPLALKSVTEDLPSGDRMFPPGPNADAINDNCLACHSADMVLNQPTLPRATWESEIDKMINVYKAPVAPEDVPRILAYLDSIKGLRPDRSSPQGR